MKKEIRIVNKEKKILQVTTIDERWYIKESTNAVNGLPEYKYVPSVTWIANYYPKGIAYYKWLAEKGWDESEILKQAAADKGSKVHHAISDLIQGKTVQIDSGYKDSSGEESELKLEEYEAIMSFVKWCEAVKPKFLENEFAVFNDEYNYAGTVDLTCEIDGKVYILDLKTSQYIWPSHRLQISAYKHCSEKEYQTAILQLGYRMNKNRYKFTSIEDCFDLFLAAQRIWDSENKDVSPKQIEYPLELKLS